MKRTTPKAINPHAAARMPNGCRKSSGVPKPLRIKAIPGPTAVIKLTQVKMAFIDARRRPKMSSREGEGLTFGAVFLRPSGRVPYSSVQ